MCGVGRLEVYEICNHRLVYREVVRGSIRYKKSKLWLFRNVACGDSTGSSLIGKDWVRVLPGLVWGKWKKGWCDLVCRGSL